MPHFYSDQVPLWQHETKAQQKFDFLLSSNREQRELELEKAYSQFIVQAVRGLEPTSFSYDQEKHCWSVPTNINCNGKNLVLEIKGKVRPGVFGKFSYLTKPSERQKFNYAEQLENVDELYFFPNTKNSQEIRFQLGHRKDFAGELVSNTEFAAFIGSLPEIKSQVDNYFKDIEPKLAIDLREELINQLSGLTSDAMDMPLIQNLFGTPSLRLKSEKHQLIYLENGMAHWQRKLYIVGVNYEADNEITQDNDYPIASLTIDSALPDNLSEEDMVNCVIKLECYTAKFYNTPLIKNLNPQLGSLSELVKKINQYQDDFIELISQKKQPVQITEQSMQATLSKAKWQQSQGIGAPRIKIQRDEDDINVENLYIKETSTFIACGQGTRDYQEDRSGSHLIEFDSKPENFNMGQSLYNALLNLGTACSSFEHGSTLVASIVYQNKIYTASVGDSSAFLVYQARHGWEIQRLSVLHKPKLFEENEHIQSVGGYVKFDRLNGILALSRALGDKHIFPGVRYEPDVSSIEFSSDAEAYLLLCSDGMTDALDEQDITEIFANLTNLQIEDTKNIANLIRSRAYQWGSNDNTTVLVTSLAKSKKTKELDANRAILAFVADGHGLFRYNPVSLENQTANYIKTHLAEELKEEIARTTLNQENLEPNEKILSELKIDTQRLIYLINSPAKLETSIGKIQEKMATCFSGGLASPEAQPYLKHLNKIFKIIEQFSELVRLAISEHLKPGNKLLHLQKMANLVELKLEKYKIVDYIGVKLKPEQRKVLLDFTIAELATAACIPLRNFQLPSAISIVKSVLEIDPISEWEKLFHLYSKVNQLISSNLNKIDDKTMTTLEELRRIIITIKEEPCKEQLLGLLNTYKKNLLSNLLASEEEKALFSKLVSFTPNSIQLFWKDAVFGFSQNIITRLDEIHRNLILTVDDSLAQLIDLSLNEQLKAGNSGPKNLISGYLLDCKRWRNEEDTLSIPYHTAKLFLQLNSFESILINKYITAYITYRNMFFVKATVNEKRNAYQELHACSRALFDKYKNFFKAITLMFYLDEKVTDLFAEAGFVLQPIGRNLLKCHHEINFQFNHIKAKNDANINLNSVEKLFKYVQNFIQLISILPAEFYPRNYIKLLEAKNINTRLYEELLKLVIYDYQYADIRKLEQEILRLKRQLIFSDLPEPNNWRQQFNLKFKYHKKWLALSDKSFSSYKNLYQILKYQEFEEKLDSGDQSLNNLKKMIDQYKNEITELMDVPVELVELKLSEKNSGIVQDEVNDIFGEHQNILKESLGLTEINTTVKDYLRNLSFAFNDVDNPLCLLKNYYWPIDAKQVDKSSQLMFILSLLKHAVNTNNKLLQKTCYLAMVSILLNFDLTIIDNFKKAYLCYLEIEIFTFNQELSDEDGLKSNLNNLKNLLEENLAKFNITSNKINYSHIKKFYKQTYLQRDFYFSSFSSFKKIKLNLEHEDRLPKCLELFNKSIDGWINFFAQLSFPEFKPHFLVSQMALDFLQVSCQLIFKLYTREDYSEICENTVNKVKLLIINIYPWLKNDNQIRVFWRKLIDVISNKVYLSKKMSQPVLSFVISVLLNAEKCFDAGESSQKPNFAPIMHDLFNNNEIFGTLLNELDFVKQKILKKPNNRILLLKAKIVCVQYITLQFYAEDSLKITTEFTKFSFLLDYFFSLLDQNRWMIDVELLKLLTKANNYFYIQQLETTNISQVNNVFDRNYLPKILEFFDYKLSQPLDSVSDRKACEESFLEIAKNIIQVISRSRQHTEDADPEITDLISSPDKKLATLLKLLVLLDKLNESKLKNYLKNIVISEINIQELLSVGSIEKVDNINLELYKLENFFENKMDVKAAEVSRVFQKMQNFFYGSLFDKNNTNHLTVFYKTKVFSDNIPGLYKDDEIKNIFLNFSIKKNDLDKNLLTKIEKGKLNLNQAFEIIPAEDKQLLYQAVNAALKSYKGRKQVKTLVKQLNADSLQSLKLPVAHQQVLRKFSSLLVSSSLSNHEPIVSDGEKLNHYLITKILNKVSLSDKTKLNLAKYSPDVFNKIDYKKLCHEPDGIVEALLIKPALLNTIINEKNIKPEFLFKKFKPEHWEKLIFNASYPLAKAIITKPSIKAELDKVKFNNKNVLSLIEFICKLVPDANGKLPVWSLQNEDMSVLSFSTIVRWGLEERDETIKRFIVNEPNLLQKLLTLVNQPKATLMSEQAIQHNAAYLLKTILGCQLKSAKDAESSLATVFAKNVLADEMLSSLCKQEHVKSILLDMHIADNLKVKYLGQDIICTVNKNELTKLKLMLEPMLDKKSKKGKEKEDEKNSNDSQLHSEKFSITNRLDNVTETAQPASKQQQLEKLNKKYQELTLFFKQAKAGEIPKASHLLKMDLEMAKRDLKILSHKIALLA